MDQVYSKADLKRLLPHHKFYLDKKISLDTLKIYQGGYATVGKMNGRYTFPVFQDKVPEKYYRLYGSLTALYPFLYLS